MGAFLENLADRQAYPINKRHFTCGRNDDNDMVIPDGEVSRVQFRISYQNGGYFITNISTNGTSLNGQPINESHLRSGDIISFCNKRYQFKFNFDGLVNGDNGNGGIFGQFKKEIRRSLKSGWRLAELRNIWIGCGLFILGALLPLFASVSMPTGGIAGVIVFAVVLFVLSLMKFYLIHVVMGVNFAFTFLIFTLARFDVGPISVGAGMGVFVFLAGSVFLLVGGYQGFDRLYRKN